MQATGYVRNKTRNNPDAAYKCPICGKNHSYKRNDWVKRYSTRLRDCKEGNIRMSIPDKVTTLKKIRGCIRWKHTAGV